MSRGQVQTVICVIHRECLSSELPLAIPFQRYFVSLLLCVWSACISWRTRDEQGTPLRCLFFPSIVGPRDQTLAVMLLSHWPSCFFWIPSRVFFLELKSGAECRQSILHREMSPRQWVPNDTHLRVMGDSIATLGWEWGNWFQWLLSSLLPHLTALRKIIPWGWKQVLGVFS